MLNARATRRRTAPDSGRSAETSRIESLRAECLRAECRSRFGAAGLAAAAAGSWIIESSETGR